MIDQMNEYITDKINYLDLLIGFRIAAFQRFVKRYIKREEEVDLSLQMTDFGIL